MTVGKDMTQRSLSPQKFVAKWRKSEVKESDAAHEHFLDLCRLFSYPIPIENDATRAAAHM